MSEHERRLIQFDDLNLLGKAIFLGGVITRVAGTVIDSTVRAATDIYLEAEKAFMEELDPNIEDAKILEEKEEPGTRGSAGTPG
jgi:hypothetical protein